MAKRDVRDTGGALAYLTDCTLATAEKLAMKKSASKSELRRQIEMAQKAIDWMDKFDVDYSHTRAAEVKAVGGKVQDWVNQHKFNF